ncbi:PA2779 family protein [Roseateles koreensis]|uniref:PA2779 family protein n=1 Tax=Roseateles koreensis TaxID=2987526 RepID=A0ABT5KLK1_9BURK|nr:PA2779 family protein [Roseateles koreensis]MDC8783763.1 PA2779 family protein [Roseateles koreensis]
MSAFKRLVASTLITSITLMSAPMHAHADIVPTDALLAPAATDADAHARVDAFFARADVQRALVSQGVDPLAAQARVAALSDAELAQLDGRITQAPAGGDVLGLIFTVFVILLVTDILGFTKVFPFTRSIR